MTAESEGSAAEAGTQDTGEPAPSPPVTGEEHAKRIAELFHQYHCKLVKSLVARTRSWEEARDIASQAFAELLALERPGSVGFYGAYLYRTARNLATNHLIRRSMRRRKDSVAGCDPAWTSPAPEPSCVEGERHAVLQRAIKGLPAHWRTALVLRVWDELSYEEIVDRFAASGVELNERTIRRYVASAFERCRREIQAAEGPLKENGR
ncbi:MAG: RNA polymerase sigma factor [Steroidobacteraceae bacterium]